MVHIIVKAAQYLHTELSNANDRYQDGLSASEYIKLVREIVNKYNHLTNQDLK